MLSETPGKKLNTYVPNYVVFDLETTGTSCATDAVVEISAVKVVNHRVVDEFSTLVNPQRPIPYWASQVNGIDDDMVADSPLFVDALRAFLSFAANYVLVGHNIHTFDMKFLQRDALDYWGKSVGNDYIDTLPLARHLLPEMRHHRLVDLAEHYHISSRGAHRALTDCRMNQQVFEMLGQELAAAPPDSELICPKCGQLLKKRAGKFGPFWGCTGFPDCRFTRNIR